MTRTAEMADVVFPSSASWCEAEGTVTNSERRVQRVRKALDPPGEARDDMWIIAELARRLGRDWPEPVAEDVWDELRSLSPMHGGMSYARLEEHGGLQWPCPDEAHPGSPLLHERLWAEPLAGPPAPFSVVEAKGPFEALDAEYPIRLTTGRRLESYNTGRAVRPLPLAPPSRRVARPLARGRRAARARRRRARTRLLPSWLGRGPGADRSVAAARARLHDVPLPRPGRHEPAHDRRRPTRSPARPSSRRRRSASRSSSRPEREERAGVTVPAAVGGQP